MLWQNLEDGSRNSKTMERIQPSINIKGMTYYPTGYEWLLYFAYAGCEWAIEALIKEAEIRKQGGWKEGE